MNWLEGLPSGAWALIGAVVASIISYLALLQQNRLQTKREDRARIVLVADRKRDERRSAYAGLLLSARRADSKITRYFNQEQFNHGAQEPPGIENYDYIWEQYTGDFNESSTITQLVATEAIGGRINLATTYFTECVIAIAEGDPKPSPKPHPIKVLEEMMATELEYRDPASRGSSDGTTQETSF